MKHPRKTFVLVADASRARLFLMAETTRKLALVEEFDHPKGRAKTQDLMADKPGRTFESSPTSAARSSKEYRTDPKRVEAEKFARELGHRLVALYETQAFEDLVIAAPAKFLGLLRNHLAPHVFDSVIAWHEKDYTTMTDISELSALVAIAE